MTPNLLLFSHTFYPEIKKWFRAADIHQMTADADILNAAKNKPYQQMAQLVQCLFGGYDKLTVITRFNADGCYSVCESGQYLAFKILLNDLKDTYELNDFHTAVMQHLKSHELLVEAYLVVKKELVSAEISHSVSNLQLLKSLIETYEGLIGQSSAALEVYKCDVIRRFGGCSKWATFS